MAKRYVSNERITPELFANPWLEKLSHVHPTVPLVIYVPVITFCLVRAIVVFSLSTPVMIGLFVGGGLLWTLMEYSIHRYVFHYHPKSMIGQRVHFLIHGVHHDYPRDPMRLVMPPVVSIPLAFLFWGLFWPILGDALALPLYAGFVAGYLGYDMIHYGTHHFSMKATKVGLWIKQYHSRHHYEDEKFGFGVSNPLWDYVFGSTPEKIRKAEKAEQKVHA